MSELMKTTGNSASPRDKWPLELPEHPKDWTRDLAMHLNFGPKGGAATYNIKDAQGTVMPFWYQYDTRKGGLTGFILPDLEQALSGMNCEDYGLRI